MGVYTSSAGCKHPADEVYQPTNFTVVVINTIYTMLLTSSNALWPVITIHLIQATRPIVTHNNTHKRKKGREGGRNEGRKKGTKEGRNERKKASMSTIPKTLDSVSLN